MACDISALQPACVGVNIFFWLLLPVSILTFFMLSRRHSKKQEEVKQRFLEEEEAANAVRKKDIDPKLYYTPDLTAFPPLPPGDPHQVERSAKRTMIRLPRPLTNLELKMQYGLAQMDIIAQYEENFNEYLKSLTMWGASIAKENPSDAVTILETVVSYGGEFRDAYKTAADIYVAQGDGKKLDALFARTEENHFTDPSIKRQLLDYISSARGDAQ
ncbi:MAG: hypothetical protein FWF80_00475 [Defluviitaleaceae bacterium]|nr:hypothetical protein [Defluviitaleaceae bacterium]